MKKIMIHSLVPISEIAKVTSTSQQNIHNTYIHNINGKNKKQMLKALAYGAFMMEQKLTPTEMKKARKLIVAMRDDKNSR